MKRKFITWALAGSLISLPCHRPSAQIAPAAFCIVISAVVIAGGVTIWVSSCKPKYYCIRDDENNLQWCEITTKREALISGYKIVSGPWNDAQACDHSCHPTNLLTKVVLPQPKVIGPLIHIERSTDLQTWTECASFVGDPESFEWSESMQEATCFYRVWY